VPADQASCQLLRAMVRRNASADFVGLSELIENVQEWDSLITLALEHGVLPLLFSWLSDLALTIPLEAQQRLRREYERNVFHSLANTAELVGLLKTFDSVEIAAMPLKGLVLAASAYGDLTIRPAGDVDILIYLRHLEKATEILLQRGFEIKRGALVDGKLQDPNSTYEFHFERQTDGMIVELCWRLELTWSRFTRSRDMDWLWPRRRTVVLAGAEVPNLDPEATLLVLCMHGSRHVWSRLIWIYDVAQLLDSHPTLDWKEVTDEAKRLGLVRSLALGVLLANRVVGISVPQTILERFESDRTASNLAQHIESNLFDAPGQPPKGRMPYSIQLLGPSDRLRLLFSPEALRPNDRDRASIALPKSLRVLYYLVRPIRLLFDRSAR